MIKAEVLEARRMLSAATTSLIIFPPPSTPHIDNVYLEDLDIVAPGATVHMFASINSAASLPATSSVQFSISADAIAGDADDILLATAPATATNAVPGTIPASLPAGTYYF